MGVRVWVVVVEVRVGMGMVVGVMVWEEGQVGLTEKEAF